jgi:eukaryotic-like serine/threonine-protein kinase
MMSIRERIEWFLRMGLLVFVLAAAAFLSAVTAMRFAIRGREVDMPNLVGKNSADAYALLRTRGLQLKVVDRIYSDLPANVVARQSPPAGEHMKISQDAHVVLSLGPQNVTIPHLIGVSLRVARIQLLQAGLQMGEITYYAAPDLLADTVLQQDPTSGQRAASLRVNLLVSQAEAQPAYVMPGFVGMPLSDADRQILLDGLKVAKFTYAPSDRWPKGAVTGQTPDQGSKVTSDTPVELVIAQ